MTPREDAGQDALLMTATQCRLGPVVEDPSLARQRLIGEEDQSVPGWDDLP